MNIIFCSFVPTLSILVTGVSYGLSCIIMTPAGAIADIIGPEKALIGAVCLPFLAILTLRLNRKVEI